MKKIIALMLTMLVASPFANAADVKVEWRDLNEFTDIAHGNTQSKTKFRENLVNEITRAFEDNAARLDDRYRMEVVIFDIDLAGSVQRGLQVQVRKIEDHDFPRINFYMYVYDEKDNLILQGAQRLRERKDKHNAFRMKGSQSNFYLEKDLIKKWFDLALIPALEK